jgi:hypothetical protein
MQQSKTLTADVYGGLLDRLETQWAMRLKVV